MVVRPVLTQQHLEVAFGCYFASVGGNGARVADHAHGAAGDLVARGWLERRDDADGPSWWWTPAAQQVFVASALSTAEGVVR
jgi:hypothetical protein